MFKFFASIANLIATVVKYVVSVFTALFTLVVRILQAFAYILTVVGWLPGYLKVFVLAMIGVSVLLFVINRGSD